MGRKVIALSWVLLLLGAFAYGTENDPTGTWKVTRIFGKIGLSSEASLTLKLDGKKLTGVLTAQRSGNMTEISDGTFKDNEITFTLNTTTPEGRKKQDKFAGVLMGDTFKGKSVSVTEERRPIGVEIEWKAERQK